ncbi:MAG: patatin-like phospholipase family protein [Actinomycetota bacterium]|nr:patatin-like phospholipase family protein [Actinomycetota bacterium]
MTPSPAGPRRGFVLGAGGVLGFAWAVGALTALEQARGFDARAADVLVGTSAGSVTAAMLGAGIAVETMLRHQQGIVVEGDPRIDYDYETDSGGALPPPPKPFPGAPGLLARTMLHPRRVPPMALLSGALPAGRGTLAPVGRMIDAIVPAGEWAPHPATWVVAMDYQTGRRVPFGRPGSPRAGIADAVMASCSIPGWYAPVRIGDRRYVDGGACSATSLDLLAPMGLDEVVVVAPMASFATDRPTSVAGRLERRFRGLVTKRLEREAEKVRRAGTAVTLLSPGPEDLEAIGANLMDSRRREAVLATSLRTSARALRGGDAAVRAGTGAGLAPVG